MIRRILSTLVVLGLLLTAYLGIRNGFNDLGQSENMAQKLVSYCVIGYGISAIVAAAGLLLHKRWTTVAMVAWGVLCTLAAYFATMVWAEAGVLVGLVGAVSSAAICALPTFYVWRIMKKEGR